MIPDLALNDGHSIPQLGLGTWPLRGDDAAEVVSAAIGLGYRHIDTARRYGNEDGVGAGIRRSGVDRGDLFVTTKLDGSTRETTARSRVSAPHSPGSVWSTSTCS